jgi:probable metal-binding protein
LVLAMRETDRIEVRDPTGGSPKQSGHDLRRAGCEPDRPGVTLRLREITTEEDSGMKEPIHGHEVMDMMVTSGKTYTKESLRADIIARFGDEARFYTCSADNMTPDELIAFLQARGKFIEAGSGFTTDQDKLCSH